MVLAITVVTLVSIAVGVSRMQRGMHFLSDVVFGGLLGAATVIVVTAILTRADRATRGCAPEGRPEVTASAHGQWTRGL